MHVLLIHQAFSGPDDPGGTRHLELGRRFVAQGNRLTVITSRYNYLTGQEKKKATPSEIDMKFAPTFSGLHHSYTSRVAAFVSFAFTSAIAGARIPELDLVLGTSPPMFQAVSAWAIAAIRRCPFVLEIRDLWPEFAVELGVVRNPLLMKVARAVERFLYHRASHIIVNSPAYREYLLGKGSPESKITVIPNGADVSAFAPDYTGEDFRRAHGLLGKFVVMYAGAIGLANDVDCLLRAAHRLQDESNILSVIVGDGKERERLCDLAESMHLDNVVFVPAQSKHEMPGILAAADVCVATLKNIPMFRSTYPNKVFDYMAAGRPIVLAIDGVIREVVENAQAGIFAPPGDDHAIAEAIRKLRDNPTVGQRMGRNGRRYVEQYCKRDMQAKQFVELLEKISTD